MQIIKYINITLDRILSRDRQSNRNCKYNYGTISINILLLPIKRLEKWLPLAKFTENNTINKLTDIMLFYVTYG